MIDEHSKHAQVSQDLNIKITVKVILNDPIKNKYTQIITVPSTSLS